MKMRKLLAAATALILLLGIAATPDVGSEIKLALTAHAESSEIPIDAEHFPDENFRKYVLKNCDTDKNGVLSDKEIKAVKEIDVLSDPSADDEDKIKSLEGIEYFTDLTLLDCSYNMLTDLDVNGCTALESLSCVANELTELDVSRLTALTYLDCSGNQLTELDINKNIKLGELNCSVNFLETLDVTNNAALTKLDCSYSIYLSSVDVKNNKALKILNCIYSPLNKLDVSQNTALIELDCDDTQLSLLDVSNNKELEILSCGGNEIEKLNLSNNYKLKYLYCYMNELSSLDLSNNVELELLDCWANKLSKLDVSKNTKLFRLNFSDNEIAELDVKNNTKLKQLVCHNNKITELDISNCPNIITVYTKGSVPLEEPSEGVIAKEYGDIQDYYGNYYLIYVDKATNIITESKQQQVGTANVPGAAKNPNVDITDMGITFEDESGETYTAQVQADGKIMLPSLPAGEYTVTASLENCPSRDYTVKVESGKPVEIEVELKLYGDISGDGELTVFDVMPVNKCAQKTGTLAGYDFKVADVTNDNKLDVFDCMKINAHIKKTTLMW